MLRYVLETILDPTAMLLEMRPPYGTLGGRLRLFLKRLQRFLCVLLAFGIGSHLSSGQDADVAQSDEEIVKNIATQVAEERAKLFCGRVVVAGVQACESPISTKRHGKIAVALVLAFDDSRTSSFVQGTSPWFDRALDRWVAAEYAIVRSPGITAVYSEKSGLVSLFPPFAEIKNVGSGVGESIDPRWFGAGLVTTVMSPSKSYSALHLVAFLSGKNATIERKSGELTRLEWESKTRRKTIWIDEVNGLTVNKVEVAYRYADVDDNAWQLPSQEQSINWSAIDGIWVPSSYSMLMREEDISNGPRSREARQYTTTTLNWSLKWENVNGDISSAQFSQDAIAVPGGTPIVDRRAGRLDQITLSPADAHPEKGVFPKGLAGITPERLAELTRPREPLKEKSVAAPRLVIWWVTTAILAYCLWYAYNRARKSTN